MGARHLRHVVKPRLHEAEPEREASHQHECGDPEQLRAVVAVREQALHDERAPQAPPPPRRPRTRAPGRLSPALAAAGRVPPSAKPHTGCPPPGTRASSTMSAPSARASHASGRMNGRRASTNAATPSASANPHESDESTNAAGRSGVCQNSTDASPCTEAPRCRPPSPAPPPSPRPQAPLGPPARREGRRRAPGPRTPPRRRARRRARRRPPVRGVGCGERTSANSRSGRPRSAKMHTMPAASATAHTGQARAKNSSGSPGRRPASARTPSSAASTTSAPPPAPPRKRYPMTSESNMRPRPAPRLERRRVPPLCRNVASHRYYSSIATARTGRTRSLAVRSRLLAAWLHLLAAMPSQQPVHSAGRALPESSL